MKEDGFTGLTWRAKRRRSGRFQHPRGRQRRLVRPLFGIESQQARRAGALALVLVNLALAGEAAFYLTLVSPADDEARALAAVAVRTLLLAAVAAMAAVIARRQAARSPDPQVRAKRQR